MSSGSPTTTPRRWRPLRGDPFGRSGRDSVRPGTRAPPSPGMRDLKTARRHFARWHLGFDRYIAYVLPLLFLVAILPILDVVYWIGLRALPTLTWTTVTGSGTYDLYPAIAGTFWIMLLALAIALLLGFFGGVATAEFLSERSASWIRLSVNTLAGMPAIVIGMTVFIVFVVFLGWGLVLIAASIATGIFMTPYVFRATDLAFASVPRHLREAALGAGARPIDYLVRVASPVAIGQVLSGVLFAFSLGVGEAATVVILVLRSPVAPTSLFGQSDSLVSVIWANWESPLPLAVTQAFQAGFILLVIVVVINVVVRFVAWHYQRRLVGLFA